MLQEISRELMQADELSVALTPESIAEADARLLAEEQKLGGERDALLLNLKKAATGTTSAVADVVEELTQTLVRLQAEQEGSLTSLQKVKERKAQLDEYREILGQEIARLERTVEAGSVLADLKVTHCPACDQEISKTGVESDHCYVCRQPISSIADAAGVSRVQFELRQLRVEAAELDELVAGLALEIASLDEHLTLLSAKIRGAQELLRPVRTAAAAILPPELAVTNMSIGRLQERRSQLQRVKAALDRREILSKGILAIQTEINDLSKVVISKTGGVDYQQLGDRLADGMNTYLNKLNKANKNAWLVGDVSVQLQDRSLNIRVGKAHWQTKLGGTLTLYFLLAYHYALLDLMRFPQSHFPGLLLIDFPAELEGTSVADKENFVVEPFIELLSQKNMQQCQMIAAGSGFVGLQGAQRIKLTHVWKG